MLIPYSASCATTHKAELAYESAFLRKICFQPFVVWPKENTLCCDTFRTFVCMVQHVKILPLQWVWGGTTFWTNQNRQGSWSV